MEEIHQIPRKVGVTVRKRAWVGRRDGSVSVALSEAILRDGSTSTSGY